MYVYAMCVRVCVTYLVECFCLVKSLEVHSYLSALLGSVLQLLKVLHKTNALHRYTHTHTHTLTTQIELGTKEGRSVLLRVCACVPVRSTHVCTHTHMKVSTSDERPVCHCKVQLLQCVFCQDTP